MVYYCDSCNSIVKTLWLTEIDALHYCDCIEWDDETFFYHDTKLLRSDNTSDKSLYDPYPIKDFDPLWFDDTK